MTTTHTITRRGVSETFESDLTLLEALAILEKSERLSEFAKSLLEKARAGYFLSPTQVAWIHRIALDLRDAAPSKLDLTPILDLLRCAAEAQKRYPRITLRDGDNAVIQITLARDGRRAWVRSPETRNLSARLRACIEADGRVTSREARFKRVLEPVLAALAADPAAVAGQHGVATGMCSFCGRPLSDARSREVGYGPICADRFGLPWGSREHVDAQHSAALVAGETLVSSTEEQGNGRR